ncbi:MAG: lipopolysaccharide export LptBFGC system permease protein LptF [Paraglaciecola sp.]|jgi:lipopolysaccharide export LptBFGC system permease protein LptF
MKLYFSTRHIPQLKNLPLTERLAYIQAAQKKLSGPEKLLLNVLALLIVVPVFVLILRTSESYLSLLWGALVALTYPVILKPIQYSLCAKYISDIRQKGD